MVFGPVCPAWQSKHCLLSTEEVKSNFEAKLHGVLAPGLVGAALRYLHLLAKVQKAIFAFQHLGAKVTLAPSQKWIITTITNTTTTKVQGLRAISNKGTEVTLFYIQLTSVQYIETSNS